jgi:hypothetical protein
MRRPRFRVIALLIVAGLAAVGSRYLRFRIVPQASEPKLNLAAIRTAEESYFYQFGEYVSVAPAPPEPTGGQLFEWSALGPDHGFARLGWTPEGRVRCRYAVAATATAYTAEALCPNPEDPEGEPVAWGYVKPEEGKTLGLVGPFGRCGPRGVLVGSATDGMFEIVGRCGLPGPIR